MSSKPFFSIIIPCKEIDPYTIESIDGCKRLNYPNFEIIVLPDYSSFTIDDVKIIPTGPVSPGKKRNIGLKNSSGEFCAFIDNDAYPQSDWLSKALDFLKDPQVAGVGGPGLTPKEDNLLQKAGGYVMSSFMMGNLASRYKTKSNFESTDIHSCNFIARKSVVEEAGGWNEKYWPGEDTLMCLAIQKTGKKLIESSRVVVYHHRRSLFKAHIKQVSRFGQHRGYFVKKFPENSVKLTYFFPASLLLAFLFGIVLSIVYQPFTFLLLIGIGIYLILDFTAAISQIKNAKLVVLVFAGIIVTHLVYGLYFISGLLKRDLKR